LENLPHTLSYVCLPRGGGGTTQFCTFSLYFYRIMPPWNLATTNYGVIKEQQFEVAVLPIGATEPHNLHLPYSTDTLCTTRIAERICQTAWNRGAKVVLLPTIPYGTQTNQREFPLALNVNPSTMNQLLVDLIESLAYRNIRKIVLLNGHGGNEFKSFLRESYGKIEAKIFACDWFRCFNDKNKEIFDEPDDHAGEMETSLVLALAPELVVQDEQGRLLADDGAVQSTRFEAVNRGWVSVARPWHLLTSNTGSGNPHKATAVKGERVLELVVERLSQFLVELAASPLDETFPFGKVLSNGRTE